MGFRPAQLMHSLDQDRKNLTHLARAASGKKTDQIRIAFEIDLFLAQLFDQWMPDKECAQATLVVQIGFKRKEAEHQIEGVDHLFDPRRIPRPDLWTDIVNNFL